MSPNLKKIMQFGLDNNLEIVSYGLAPNPNGFCFESHGKASNIVKKTFFDELENLSTEEVEQLRKAISP